LTLSRITSADAGTYNVLVTSPAGTVPSLSAQLVVTNVVLTPPTMLSSHLLNDGSFRISFSGPEGQTYRVLATSDLTLPMTSWTVLTNGAFTAEPIQVIDPAASLPQRFYRIASP